MRMPPAPLCVMNIVILKCCTTSPLHRVFSKQSPAENACCFLSHGKCSLTPLASLHLLGFPPTCSKEEGNISLQPHQQELAQLYFTGKLTNNRRIWAAPRDCICLLLGCSICSWHQWKPECSIKSRQSLLAGAWGKQSQPVLQTRLMAFISPHPARFGNDETLKQKAWNWHLDFLPCSCHSKEEQRHKVAFNVGNSLCAML